MSEVIQKLTFISLIFTFFTCNNGDEICPNIISRAQWQARQPTGENFLINPLAYVAIHHTVTPECNSIDSCSSQVRSIQNYHMDELNWADIGFSFFIGADGNVYEGAGWSKEGAHTYHWNKKSIGIAFIGNYQSKNASDKMIYAAKKLISCGKSQGMLRPDVKIFGGNQVTSTASPGAKLYQQIQNWSEWTSNP